LEEKGEKGLCYSCVRKYTKGHKCIVKKLFHIDFVKRGKKRNKKHKKEEDIHHEHTLEKE